MSKAYIWTNNNITVDVQFLLNCYRIHFMIPKIIVNEKLLLSNII